MIVLPYAIHFLHLDSAAQLVITYGRWPAIWLLIAGGLSILYRFGPTDSLEPKWRWLTWGSAFASLAWLGASILFSWYAANFGSYNETYGSLGAAIGFMTWMWISATVIIMGAELNAEIEQAAEKTETETCKSLHQPSFATTPNLREGSADPTQPPAVDGAKGLTLTDVVNM